MVPTGLEARARVAVVHAALDVDVDAAQLVDDVGETLEAGDHVVLHGEAGEPADRLGHQRWPTERHRVGELAVAMARDLHPRVAREPEQRALPALRVHAEQVDGVTVGPAGVVAGTRVRAHGEDEDEA